jgi:hypothetical protein
MKRSDFVYFNIDQYLNLSINKLIIDELPVFDNKDSIIILSDGSVTAQNLDPDSKPQGHIRNNQLEENTLNTILPTGFLELKNKTKQLVIEKGFSKPVLRGISNFKNPDSIKWHKDYISPEMQIDPKKRIVIFYIAADNLIDATFMVSPGADGPGIWNLGFKLNLANNLLIGHNQNMGHEYQINTPHDINILSLLWYDFG